VNIGSVILSKVANEHSFGRTGDRRRISLDQSPYFAREQIRRIVQEIYLLTAVPTITIYLTPCPFNGFPPSYWRLL
jgi:hypothetical protein